MIHINNVQTNLCGVSDSPTFTIQEPISFTGLSSYSYQKAKWYLDHEWLEKTMIECKYNQSKAASRMKISRGTFRKLLRTHFGDKYFKTSI